MRAARLRTPLLLILAVLALAGPAGEWQAWWAGAAGSPAGAEHGAGWTADTPAPDQPARLGGSARTGVAAGARVAGGSPGDDLCRHPLTPGAGFAAEQRPAAALGLHLAARARLGFAHDATLSLAGAYSSFGTSLPPPLLA